LNRERCLRPYSPRSSATGKLRELHRDRQEAEQRWARLTPREREVLDLVVNGRLNKQIAAELGVAEKTIKVHRARVMRKFGVRTIADLVRRVVARGS
jgi:FixJ family two-component response regulator